ncbi:MAG TPA: D-alanine--D-alanine ligase family protein [Thermoanaerobaculia bacterium]|nr:D-alanine--D-alanine ligase family protein [Thermoanaerobaculia bacterium]
MTRAVLLFGGRSAEHEVSILSARSIHKAAAGKIDFTPVCIARDGRFIAPERSVRILEAAERSLTGDADFSFEGWARANGIEVVFPVVHGTGGEDGSLQGYLETIGIPYVGSGVTASVVAMDKGHMKQAFASAKLPIVDHVEVREAEWTRSRDRVSRSIINALRLPYFVKPANSGSSVGVTKVKNEEMLGKAVDFALSLDEKILVERGIDARELEVAVLGTEEPKTSVAGEIVPTREFYDYEDKYVSGEAKLIVPAKLPAEKSEELRRHALTAFRAVGASGFARVDFLMERGTNRVFVSEINTIPGFTTFSMFPRLWEATEIKYSRLIELIIELGLRDWKKREGRRERGMAWLAEAKRLG